MMDSIGGPQINVFAGPQMLAYAALVIVALALGGLRIVGVKTEAFKALAHVYVGGLIGYYTATALDGVPNYLVLWVAVGLSVLETVAFLVSRFAPKAA